MLAAPSEHSRGLANIRVAGVSHTFPVLSLVLLVPALSPRGGNVNLVGWTRSLCFAQLLRRCQRSRFNFPPLSYLPPSSYSRLYCRCCRPTEIDSIYAAVASGIPDAVPAVLGCIRHSQAVDELTARNVRNLVERHKSISVFSATPRGSGGSGGSGGYDSFIAGGANGGKECEELETLEMLAALSGNLDMLNAVLRALLEKLPNEQQVWPLRAYQGSLSLPLTSVHSLRLELCERKDVCHGRIPHDEDLLPSSSSLRAFSLAAGLREEKLGRIYT